MIRSNNGVYTDPADLTAALVAKARGQEVAIVVPTIREQLTELIQPGRAIGFRTESGSHYELTIYTTGQARLIKIVDEDKPGGLKSVAYGEISGAHDHNRGVYGIVVKESDGREYKTSAVVKVWLAFDALANTNHAEPSGGIR
jgi:hypothetical protein